MLSMYFAMSMLSKLQVKKLQLILRQLVPDIDLHAYDVAMEVPR